MVSIYGGNTKYITEEKLMSSSYWVTNVWNQSKKMVSSKIFIALMIVIITSFFENWLSSFHKTNPKNELVTVVLNLLKTLTPYLNSLGGIYGLISANASIISLEESRKKEIIIPERLAISFGVDLNKLKTTNGEFGPDTKQFLTKVHFYLQSMNMLNSKEVASPRYFDTSKRSIMIESSDFVELFTYSMQHYPEVLRKDYLNLIFDNFSSINKKVSMINVEFAYYLFLCNIGIKIDKSIKLDLLSLSCLEATIDASNIQNETELIQAKMLSLKLITNVGSSIVDAAQNAQLTNQQASFQEQLNVFCNLYF